MGARSPGVEHPRRKIEPRSFDAAAGSLSFNASSMKVKELITLNRGGRLVAGASDGQPSSVPSSDDTRYGYVFRQTQR
jgi:hypothetical protein